LIMFFLVATALAGGVQIGFPCQRLNWGWRNVWSTCSINSFVPVAATAALDAVTPNGFQRSSATPLTPLTNLLPTGVYTPIGSGASTTVPQNLCSAATLTGTGNSAGLRNRCRRALDAYGALVVQCKSPTENALTASGLATPDFVPANGHLPHVANVQGLTWNAQMCLMPAGAYTPANLNSPSNTCPGLLGWFTVVYSACKFSYANGLANGPSVPGNLATYFPLGNVAQASAAGLGFVNPVSPANRAGYFCTTRTGSPVGNGAPDVWNDATGTAFRTSRCRKALDQFGRTAQRCATSTSSLSGPSQAGGYSDPLRFLAVGTAGNSPMGFNSFAPACN
jgi:hypothetical protein